MITKFGKKLNLDKYAVFVEDTSDKSTYFNISELSETLTSGKNTFLLKGSKYLKDRSQILIEITDANNNVLYTEIAKNSDYIEYKYNTYVLVACHVRNTHAPGDGIIRIVSNLKESTTGAKPTTNDFVRWTKKIIINPNKENSTPVKFYKQPEIEIVNKFPRLVTYTTGSLTKLTSSGYCFGVPELPANNTNYNLFNPFTDNVKYRIIHQTGNYFSSSFINKNISFYNINTQTGIIDKFNTTIKNIINKTELYINTPIYDNNKNIIPLQNNTQYVIEYQNVPELIKNSEYLKIGSFSGNIVSAENFYQSSIYYKSVASIKIKNLDTFAGTVYRMKIYRQSKNSKIDSECIADEILSSREMLIDITNPDRYKERIGVFYNAEHIINYTETSSNSIYIEHNNDKQIDSCNIRGTNNNSDTNIYAIIKDDTNIFFGNYNITDSKYDFELYRDDNHLYYNTYNENYDIENTKLYSTTTNQTQNLPYLKNNLNYLSTNYLKFYKDVEYVISANVIGTRNITPINLNKDGNITFYFIGKSLSGAPDLLTASDKAISIGIPLMTASFDMNLTEKHFGHIQSKFSFNDDVSGAVLINPIFGEYYISDISIKPYQEKGYNPGVMEIDIPFPIEIQNEIFNIKLELLDINNNKIPLDLSLDATFDSYGRTIIKPIVSANTTTIPNVSWSAVTEKPQVVSSSLQFNASDNVVFGNITGSNIKITYVGQLTSSHALTSSFIQGSNVNGPVLYAVSASYSQTISTTIDDGLF